MPLASECGVFIRWPAFGFLLRDTQQYSTIQYNTVQYYLVSAQLVYLLINCSYLLLPAIFDTLSLPIFYIVIAYSKESWQTANPLLKAV